MKKHRKLKITLIVIFIILFIAYWAFINFLINATLVPSFMETLSDFERISNEGYSSLIHTDDITVNRENEVNERNAWFETVGKEKLSITTQDGYTLIAAHFFHDENNPSDRFVLLLHGYTGIKEMMYIYAMHYYEWGYDVIVPDLRCQGESEGDYIGMGYTDASDCKGWLEVILELNPNAAIVLHGQSMGAATALIMSGEDDLPENVRYVVSDCSYTDAKTMFYQKAKEWFDLPSFPFVDSYRLAFMIRGGYDIYKASAINAVAKSRIPTLFIHGTSDVFISSSESEKLYQAAACEKKLLLIEGAGHGQSNYKAPEKVYGAIKEWIGRRNMTENNLEKKVREKYDRIVKKLIEEQLSITTMESCTAGQVASLLTDTEGSSAIIKGAFVTYSNEAKIRQGVSEETIERFGVYSEETAAEMAEACRKFYEADIGIGVTGSFGNTDPNNADSVPGEVYFAISTEKETKSFFCSIPEQPSRLYYKLFMADKIADELVILVEAI